MAHTITKDVEMSAIDTQWQGSKDTVGSTLASAVSSQAELIKDKGEVKERETWDNKFQYILAVVGFAVGLGNVWRFPYLVQKNGGGAFLIPYAIMLIIEGIPIFYLELAVGQRLRKGAIGAWNEISPYLGGIGIASAVVSFNVALYYNTIIAWCLYYMGQSFQYPLPWASCPEAAVNSTNITAPVTECQLGGAPSYFWYRETLAITPSIDVSGPPNWWLVLSLVGAWVIVFACMAKGIGSSGKVVYFTATFPYLVLVIFFVRGVTLDRFYLGLEHLFVPEWSRLADPQVWLEAATQIFFSLGLAFGGLIAFSSYMPVRNNCYRDAILVSLTNCATSIFAGIVVFSVLGYKASQTFDTCMVQQNNELISLFNTTDVVVPTAGELVNFTRFDDNSGMWIQELGIMPNITQCNFKEEIGKSASGTGLAFIAFTEAINQFPGATFWAIIFFLMLLTLGLDSMFGTLEGVVTSLVDMKLLPMLPKWALSAIICLVSLALSLCFSTGAGSYVLSLFDDFTGNIPLMMIALFQVLGISYVYGLKRFSDDIELMTGSRPNWYFLIMWRYISPLAMTGILIASVVSMITNGISYEAYVEETASVIRLAWPGWAQFLAALFIVSSVIWIPIVAILKYFNISVLAEEEPAFFPTEELKHEINFKPYQASTWEHYLFYWGEK